MRNIVIIAVIVLSLGYMFNILVGKYETIKNTNTPSTKTN